MRTPMVCLLVLSGFTLFGVGQLWQQRGTQFVASQRTGSLQITTLCTPVEISSPLPNRPEFAKKMANLETGMTSAAVLGILGPPDDIKTQNDPGGVRTNKTKEIWRYGTNGHLTFPTLGQVYIDEKDQVQYLSGHEGTPPAPSLFAEPELRCILRILSETLSYGQSKFNPRPLIRAVNTVQPLGKEKALAAINEYLRVNSRSIFRDDSRGGIFFVLRLLFEVPESPGYMPTMRIGAWSPAPPDDPKKFPLFPLVLQGDIPFDLSQSYSLAGVAEQPESHVAYFQKHGVLRKRLLQPTMQPWQAMEQVLTTHSGFPIERNRLVGQVARLLDSVYEIQDDEKWVYTSELSSKQYSHAENTIPSLVLQWDGQSNSYTFKDGQVRLPPPLPIYRREIWQPDVTDQNLKIIVERESRHVISIVVSRSYSLGSEWDGATVRVYQPSAPKNNLATFKLEKLEANSGWSSSKGILFEQGKSLVFELKGQRRTITSLLYTP